MPDQRNLLLAILLSVVIILGFQYFISPPGKEHQPSGAPSTQTQPQKETQAPATGQTGTAKTPSAGQGGGESTASAPSSGGGRAVPTPGASAKAGAAASREEVLAETPRVRIDSGRLHGSISLKGARIDDLTLADYHVGLKPTSPEITLLSPHGVERPYYAEFGWVSEEQDIKLPDANTVWHADRKTLSPGEAVTLTWDNGQGLRFVRVYALDKNYLFTVKQRVENESGRPVSLFSYGLVSRTGTPKTLGYYILHEGPLGVFDGKLKEVKYSDLKDDDHKIERESKKGWIGITDKYWLVALLPNPDERVKNRFLYDKRGGKDRYQVDYLGPKTVIPVGGSAQATDHLFAGAKEVNLLDSYGEQLGVDNLDKAIDFGWFYFLTKPLFKTLLVFHEWVGNMGIAILLLTIIIKAIFFPLANKSYRSMSKMKALQPEMTKLRERFSDDKQRLNQEMMQLYKRHKVNPASGCLPMLIQIPVFFALYKVLFVTIEMRHAPFFGWIQDLSAPDPTSVFNLFGLIPWTPPHLLHIGVWPLIMGFSMFLQQRLNPQPADATQQKIFMFLPVIFTVMLARFPAGLVIYWTWNNLLSMSQQWIIMKRMGVAKPATS